MTVGQRILFRTPGTMLLTEGFVGMVRGGRFKLVPWVGSKQGTWYDRDEVTIIRPEPTTLAPPTASRPEPKGCRQ